MKLTIEVPFCAALKLPRLEGPCQQVHGHDYRLAVTVAGQPDEGTGAIVDFVTLRETVQREIVSQVDHRYLNDVLENPTAENLVVWMWGRLKERVPSLSQLRLWESSEFSVTYEGT